MNNKLNRFIEHWQEDFLYFVSRFSQYFGRRETRGQSEKYVKALMAPVERKNGWQMAEFIGDEIPDPMQRLLFRSHWDENAVRDELQDFIIEEFGDKDGIGILDETGFIKKGKHSAGVQRQYTGSAGKVENCQIGTFLTYVTKYGHTFIDRRLFLPESWCEDKAKRNRAKIPEDVKFQTKPEQGMKMLAHAWERGVPMQWVLGDTIYGNSSGIRAMVQLAGKSYIFGVSRRITIWKKWPEPVPEKQRGRRRSSSKPKYPEPVSVAEAIANLHPRRWRRYSAGDGEKGHRVYDWTRMRVVENEDGLPVRESWLLARRSVSDPSDIVYFLSNAPREVKLIKLAEVSATRFAIEQCFEEAKGETGLDHYEARNWQSWYRHITLSMMAHTFLAWIRTKSTNKKKGSMSKWQKYQYLRYAN